ncbi:cobyric acid synthase [Marinicrinis lubricantis]|uniref:Cobyric acid synthase n=1 Tax=Marinicrinis lubricantis TaxID=2086470 RepID=A0ABW1IQZ7_9BACL
MTLDNRLGRTIMLQGTASDVGKSILTTALCRIWVQDGWKVAPFKSQNMSLNSYVTVDGKEIGRAQGMQADACRIQATTDMNPILLKPKRDMESQVVVHGVPFADYDARLYREEFLVGAETIVKESIDRLRRQYEIVVMEGAGSPAEVNLKDRDIVNMRMAQWADAPVLLVGDIDRGGVFASIIGTLEILSPEERDRVKGFIINKFRGDVSLLKPGLDWLEQKTGKPVLGVIPYLRDLNLEEEDSASLHLKRLDRKPNGREDVLDIAIIALPRISNFTDFDPLDKEQDVHLRYIRQPSEWGNPDAVLLPGSKNTMEDMLYLRESGLDRLIQRHAEAGKATAGICAGYQILGERLLDPDLVESRELEVAGLGLLPIVTTFSKHKTTVQVTGIARFGSYEGPIHGYEIHMGRTEFIRQIEHPFTIQAAGDRPNETPHLDGAMRNDGQIWGTYIHGIFHNDGFRRYWLNQLREAKGWSQHPKAYPFLEERDKAFDRLADHVRTHLDMKRLNQILLGEEYDV